MSLPLAFIVMGAPVSQQTRRQERLRRWREQVRNAANQRWPTGEPPVSDPVMLTIVYFYDRLSMDVDNLPKPIIDALKEIVFMDDDQVTDLTCRKRNLRGTLPVESASSVLVDGLSRGSPFVYIAVADAPD